MTFIDSSIPMYLVGGAHVHKDGSQRLLERCIAQEERLVTDTEVLQEIIHRYVAVDRRDAIQPAFEAILQVVDEVYPVEIRDVERAKGIVLGSRNLSARDALHLAIMERYAVAKILSYDTGFDGLPGITRISR